MVQGKNSGVRGEALRQLIMLSLAFLLGMGINLIGLPSETSGAAKAITTLLLVLHGLLGIGMVVLAIVILLHAAGKTRKLAQLGLATILVTFAAGILTMATESNWWSYLMAVGFLTNIWLYSAIMRKA